MYRGRLARYLPDTAVGAALAATTGHLAIVLRGAGVDAAPAYPEGIVALPVSDSDADLLRRRTGLHDGGVVVVRPDRYVGFIGSGVVEGLSTYERLLER